MAADPPLSEGSARRPGQPRQEVGANKEAAIGLCRFLAVFGVLSAIVWMALEQWPLALGFSATAAVLGLALQVLGREREPDRAASFAGSTGVLAMAIALAHLVGLL